MSLVPLNEQEYDQYLKDQLFSRIKRVGPYTYSKGTLHLCQQPECQRDWKPIPKEIVETNRNYCPSCVMSWSNRIDRFTGWREWTKDIKNCFYLWSLIDPKTGEKYWKCGRTEEIDSPGKRFAPKEIKKFSMQLEDYVVDSLLKSTTYENNFKHLIKAKNVKKIFPHEDFHGKDETFQVNDGKALFKEALELKMEEPISKKKKEDGKGISKGYCNNDNKRNGRIYDKSTKLERSKKIRKQFNKENDE